MMAIPYENLDIHLGRKLTLDPDHIYHKIVEERRGGWCYEMNGLFSQALRQIGFDVTLLGSSVGSPAQGGVEGDLDHLILLVQVDKQPWLADVGFGKGLLDPIPLQVGEIQQNYLHYRLEQEGENWYFHNQPEGGPGFGFTLLPRTYAGFASRCHELQTSPDSGFVRAPVVAQLFACSVPTVWRMAKRGDIPAPRKLSERITGWNVGELRRTLTERGSTAPVPNRGE